MSARACFRALVACWCTLLLACAGGIRPESLPKFESIEEQFKYGSVGIESEEGIPYWIWQVLPRVFADKLPRPGGYAAFGFLWEPGKELPVGFSKVDLYGGPRVAVNCAFCHTTSVRTSALAPPRIIAAGPANQINPQAYVKFLQAVADDPRFDSGELLDAIAGITRLSWRQRMQYRYLLDSRRQARAAVNSASSTAWMYRNPEWGPGRVDPFNPIKFGILKLPVDATIGNSDMVPIWNMKARQGMSLHWDGLSASLREVVLSSALGDGASRTSIQLPNLARIEQWLMDVQPPAYPYEVDQALSAEGRRRLRRSSARSAMRRAAHARARSCRSRKSEPTVIASTCGRPRRRSPTTSTPTATLTTSRDFARPVAMSRCRSMACGSGRRFCTTGRCPHCRSSSSRRRGRRQTFYRGYDVFDPVRVGFVSEGDAATRTGTLYDTRLPGNSNAGHLYGVELAPAQKKALIEFLKTQ